MPGREPGHTNMTDPRAHDTAGTIRPTCPHCGHMMDSDEMSYGEPTCDADLWSLAPDEGRAVIECPACDKQYWVQGSYVPQYTSACSEDELD